MLGLGSSLVKGGFSLLSYVKDGLKLFMPYKKGDGALQFVGTGSTSFDGDDDYVLCGDDTSLDITDDITMMAWVKPASAGQTAVIIGRDDTTNRNYVLYVQSNKFFFDYFVSGSPQRVSSSTADTANVWVHLTCTRNKATGRNIIYVNGIAEDTDTDSTASIDNDNVQFSIGANGVGGGDFTGNIKNVAVWNRALTATEVQNVMYKSYAEVSGRLASGLVSWWSLESTGTPISFADSHGSNTGTNSGATSDNDLYGGDTPVIPRAIDNAPTVQADAIGSGSALFDGIDDYIGCGADSTLNITGNITLSAWIKTSEDDHAIVGKWDNADGDGYMLYILSGGIVKFNTNNGHRPSTTTVDDGGWHHIAGTWDGTNGYVYVDGIREDGSVSGTLANPLTNSIQVIIGAFHSTPRDFFDGNICQVGIWSAALTQAQIQSIMEKTFAELTASEKTNLVSYWSLDEQTGTDGEAGTGGVKDSHGSNHGTMYDS